MAQSLQQNFDAMRQDAIRRSREMQRRAVPITPPQPPELPGETQNSLSKLDTEKLTLLAMLYLLYKEGAEVELLLAIAYILL